MDTVIEVFKTNIASEQMAHRLSERLLAYQPALQIAFDLEDCDNILRVESQTALNIEAICKICMDIEIVVEALKD